MIVGKHVSDKFKEKHDKDWKMVNTGKGKFEVLKENYRTEARWMKSIQKKKEAGMLIEDVTDIGFLIRAIQDDIREEEKENIKEELWKIFSGEILRKSIAGFPEFYKEYLNDSIIGDLTGEHTNKETIITDVVNLDTNLKFTAVAGETEQK
jgi:phage tail tape-measure protein